SQGNGALTGHTRKSDMLGKTRAELYPVGRVGQRRTLSDSFRRCRMIRPVSRRKARMTVNSNASGPNPEAVSSLTDLARELAHLRLWLGRPSFRKLEQRAERANRET